MNRCFIFAAGSFYKLYEKPEKGDLVIAADAGMLLCDRLGIKPDILVGDFDSMLAPGDIDGTEIIRLPVEKDDTDTMMAIKLGLARGCGIFLIYGGAGGERLDHTLANIQALTYLCKHASTGYLFDNHFVYTVLENAELEIKKSADDGLVSLFSLGNRCESISLSGLQYPLLNATLENSFPLGVSNHITKLPASVSVGRGPLLVGWELR